MGYNTVAVNAAKLIKARNLLPLDAWQHAVKNEYPYSVESQKKGCPRSAFLGLCSAGKITGIVPGNYTSGDLNKKYALEALSILSKNYRAEISATELWKLVLTNIGANLNKVHNGQMHVVLELWKQGLIV